MAQPFLDAALVDRFVPVNAASYDDIRQVCARVRGAGLLHPGWDARWQAVTSSAPTAGPSSTPTLGDSAT
jgi:hypothetical protein